MNSQIVDEKSFVISYRFFEETHETEIAMKIGGENILAFMRTGNLLTTRWNLDELAFWIREFLDHMAQDPYPVDVEGEYAAIKDINAREFDSDDDEEFDAYYDKLDEWNLRHRWHYASNGAILADLYFQLVDGCVEISWNNQETDDGVAFQCELGGARVSREQFEKEMTSFLNAYAAQWFKC
ncbi:MAG: hypothetical protein MJ171_00075 [Clostridia bacterium]|nr:hypothetical protein [Clostridia bacterium]